MISSRLPDESRERLTKRQYWDSVYAAESSGRYRKDGASKSGVAKLLARYISPETLTSLRRPYSEFIFWNVLLPKYRKTSTDGKCVEIGCAPGSNIILLHQNFGYEPYGVEYSEVGALRTRELFQAHGLDPSNVIQLDFFSPLFQERYVGFFEVVLSRGFVEHFRNPEQVIRAHLHVLRPGGVVIVTIPNLAGLNYWLARILTPHLLPLHNLELMKPDYFRSVCEQADLLPLYCGYSGGFDLGLFDTNSLVEAHRILLSVMRKFQIVLNLMSRVLFRSCPIETRWTSPSLVFIGRKKSTDTFISVP